jgi:hypothetical protein
MYESAKIWKEVNLADRARRQAEIKLALKAWRERFVLLFIHCCVAPALF